ncbi:MAG: hypothetical protein AAGH81_12530 [Bacteroidota bacterium]
MSVELDKIVNAVNRLEAQYRIHDPNDRESRSLLDILVKSAELTISVVKESKLDKDQREMLQKLSFRVQAVKEKAGL